MRRTLSPFVYFLLAVALSGAALAQKPNHPLDALNSTEIERTVELLKSSPRFPKTALFSTVQLKEPPKEVVLAYKPGSVFTRSSFVIVFDRVNNKTFEATVDLSAGKILSLNEIPGVQPLVFGGEYPILEGLVKSDPRWLAAMKKRAVPRNACSRSALPAIAGIRAGNAPRCGTC